MRRRTKRKIRKTILNAFHKAKVNIRCVEEDLTYPIKHITRRESPIYMVAMAISDDFDNWDDYTDPDEVRITERRNKKIWKIRRVIKPWTVITDKIP